MTVDELRQRQAELVAVAVAASPTVSRDVERQLDLLEQIVTLLEAHDDCLAVALCGSFAKGLADRVSDLDLIVFVNTSAASKVSSSIASLVDETSVFFRMDGRYDENSVFVRLILLDFTSVEFHVLDPGTPFELLAPWIALVDKDDTLRNRQGRGAAPAHDPAHAYLRGDRELAWELFNCVKWAGRGDVEAAKQYVVALAAAIGRVS